MNIVTKWKEKWASSTLYHFEKNFDIEIEKRRQSGQRLEKKEITKIKNNIFSIDTPPPTVSGTLHIGHVFSYSHTDFIARYQRMIGKDVFYPIGFDDNGLPTERLVEKVKKIRGIDYFKSGKKEEFIKECNGVIESSEKDFANLFQDLGYSFDWSKKYQTISQKTEEISHYSFKDLFDKNLIYFSDKPTYWDCEDQTAIAQTEIEDTERPAKEYYLKFYFEDKDFIFEDKNYLEIMTTRPELLCNCYAVFINPEDKRARYLRGKKLIVPIFKNKVEILIDEDVAIDKGTGLVMCCAFGNMQDYIWIKRHNLEDKQKEVISKDGKVIHEFFKKEPVEDYKEKNSNISYADVNKILEKDFENINKYKIIFKETVFYPEGGGQEGDNGFFRIRKELKERLYNHDSFFALIQSVKKIGNLIAHVFDNNPISKVQCNDDSIKSVLSSSRQDAPKNHTATHLLQAALRQVLGNHVMQKGSNVNENGLRFDFTHNKALTEEEIEKVENLIKEWIKKQCDIIHQELSKEEANKKGALCFFEDKYGERVRIIEILDRFENNKPISIEFCGGTHVKNTKEIEDFIITKETSVASGVRRIEAIAGYKANAEYWVQKFASERKINQDLSSKYRHLELELKKKDEEILKYKVIKFDKRNLVKNFSDFENSILKPLLMLNPSEIEIILEEIKNSLENNEEFNLLSLDNECTVDSVVFRQFCLNFKGKNKTSLAAIIHKKNENEESLFVNILKSQDSNFDCRKVMEIFFKERKEIHKHNSIYKAKFGGIESNLQGKIIM